MVNFSLEGKVALVTGASYGIGFAIASAFAQAGARIAFNDINQELVDKGIKAYKEEGIEAVLYSHPCNMYGHGPGPTIGLWNQQSAIPIKGDIELDVNTVYALELNVKVPCCGKDYYIYTEETVLLDENGVQFLYEGRDRITLIR